MILFFVNDIKPNFATLENDEFQHCCKVLRKKVGETIYITNGKGIFAQAIIKNIGKRNAELDILSIDEKSIPQYNIVLAVAPPKNRSRWEWLLEKSVEIGVSHIIPFTSGNSERVKFNIERSKKIMRSAALQSKRIIHPTIENVISFDKIIENENYLNYQKLIAHYKEDNAHISTIDNSIKDNIILIGPEGDFRDVEVELAQKHHFKLVNISNNRLRTETAAIVSVNLILNNH